MDKKLRCHGCRSRGRLPGELGFGGIGPRRPVAWLAGPRQVGPGRSGEASVRHRGSRVRKGCVSVCPVTRATRSWHSPALLKRPTRGAGMADLLAETNLEDLTNERPISNTGTVALGSHSLDVNL